jgi:hypothetical protein
VGRKTNPTSWKQSNKPALEGAKMIPARPLRETARERLARLEGQPQIKPRTVITSYRYVLLVVLVGMVVWVGIQAVKTSAPIVRAYGHLIEELAEPQS